jgi:ribosome-binding protein aMBF1 (putative translation factor)
MPEVTSEQAKIEFLKEELGKAVSDYADRIAALQVRHLVEKQSLAARIRELEERVRQLEDNKAGTPKAMSSDVKEEADGSG